MSMKTAFSSLKAGDLLEGPVDGESRTFVVVRHIGESVVIGDVCLCGRRHVNGVLNTTFRWDDGKQALVDLDGEVPYFWSENLTKQSGEGLDIAEGAKFIPVDADYAWKEGGDLANFLSGQESLVDQMAHVYILGQSQKSSLRRMLELSGVTMTDEQADLFFGTLGYAEENIRRSERLEAVTSIVSTLGGLFTRVSEMAAKRH